LKEIKKTKKKQRERKRHIDKNKEIQTNGNIKSMTKLKHKMMWRFEGFSNMDVFVYVGLEGF
jgi:hypothetical protein